MMMTSFSTPDIRGAVRDPLTTVALEGKNRLQSLTDTSTHMILAKYINYMHGVINRVHARSDIAQKMLLTVGSV